MKRKYELSNARKTQLLFLYIGLWTEIKQDGSESSEKKGSGYSSGFELGNFLLSIFLMKMCKNIENLSQFKILTFQGHVVPEPDDGGGGLGVGDLAGHLQLLVLLPLHPRAGRVLHQLNTLRWH